ncbi:MAG: hypothetical protein E6J62_00790 [Deltaproteobacteria bacterium]|nr:MAG: hypothetical protein E6J62_00790 [Deltaproteobacteria bacterium]
MPVSFIEHQGQRILLLDFARIRDPQIVLREIEEARKFIAQQPRRKELLTLADVSKLRFNDDVLKAFRELTKHDEPYEKAAAVFGLTTLGAVAFRANNFMTGGRLKGFEKKDDALKWLLEQAAAKS